VEDEEEEEEDASGMGGDASFDDAPCSALLLWGVLNECTWAILSPPNPCSGVLPL